LVQRAVLYAASELHLRIPAKRDAGSLQSHEGFLLRRYRLSVKRVVNAKLYEVVERPVKVQSPISGTFAVS